ncbi:MAG: TRL domain-containing protein [bacterium]|nr:TRL domain-containing protein [bacterium]
MNKIVIFSGLAAFFLLTGCASGLPESGPAIVELVKEGMPSPDGPTNRQGEACNMSVLGLVAVGDASVDAAKRNAGITNVTSLERDIFGINFYFIKFAKSCTIVRGT